MIISIPGLPISVNKAFSTDFRTKRRFKSKEYSAYEKGFKCDITEKEPIDPLDKLHVTIELHTNWLTKAGSIRKVDVANYEKTLIDVLSKRLGFEDSQIFVLTLVKVQSVEIERTIVVIGKIFK